MIFRIRSIYLVVICCFFLSGCQTLQGLKALTDVKFAIDRVSDIQLAGVNLTGISSYEDVGALDALNLGRAVLAKDLPLDFNLHLEAENPAENQVTARLVKMDWTLLLDDRETISGVFDQTVALEPGNPTNLALPIHLDLVDFFDHGIKDLFDMALAVAGQGGSPKRIKLQAIPTIETPFGAFRYPNAVTILSKEVGS